MSEPTVITDSLRLWEYAISHKAALFRRPASDADPENLDLVFFAVEYFALPTSLHGLEIAAGSASELASLSSRIGHLPSWARLFVITSQGQRHLIVAGSWVLERNHLPMFETCFGQRSPGATVIASADD
jgi:hypothetical protein